jgi:CRP/FNR family transcriptional regulator, cyclic AMP receptor protein
MDQELATTIRSTLCRRLSTEEAAELASAMVPRKVPAGGAICREGDETSGLMILLRGAADVSKRGRESASTQRVASVEAPTVLGEVSLLLPRGKYTATIRARSDCELWVLPKPDFVQMLDRENVAVFKLVATLAEVLARRLVSMDGKMLELARRGDPAAAVEEFAAFRQKFSLEWSSQGKDTV